MTICIGIRAMDGIVIAADAQETDSYFKRSVQKILIWQTIGNADGPPPNPAACVIAGAGDGDFVDAFTAEFLADVRAEMTLAEFESYAAKKVAGFYSTHVRPLLKISREYDFSVLVGAHFQRITRLYKSYGTSFRHVQAMATAVGIGQQFALRSIGDYPFADILHTQVTAAAVISDTKDCIDGCGKYTDIVSMFEPKVVPDEEHGSRIESPTPLISRVPFIQIQRWEESFSKGWRRKKCLLYEDLIEEELTRSNSQKSEDQP